MLSLRSAQILPFAMLYACAMTAGLQAESSRTPAEVGVTEHRGERVPLDVMVRDESGAERRLGDFFRRGRPVVLIPSYYHCPRLCTYVFKAVQKAVAEVRASGLAPGRDFQVLSYSFDSREGYAEAKKRATSIRSLFGAQPLPEGAWQFLSGDAAAASRLMGSIGYRYKADGESDFSHAAAIVLLAPDGKITRYLYGIEYPEREFRLSLVEAANGTIGGATEQIMLYCFRYDPVEGRYTPFAWAFVRIGGAATLALVLALIFFLLRRERRAKGA